MKKKQIKGTFFTISASLWWGIIGVFYFKFVSFASPLELTIHRTIWTAFLLVLIMFYFNKWNEFISIIKIPKNIIVLFISGVLVSLNWYTWLYSLSVDKLLDASLGYYIFPILSVFLGAIFLKENLNKNKLIAIVLVGMSLLYLLYKLNEIPWNFNYTYSNFVIFKFS